MTSKMTTMFIVALIAVTLAATAIIVTVYYLLLPKFFPELKTYSIIVIGVAGSAILGGLTARYFLTTTSGSVGWAACIGAGMVTALMTALLSVGILVSLMGS
jgi:hypothetical protein